MAKDSHWLTNQAVGKQISKFPVHSKGKRFPYIQQSLYKLPTTHSPPIKVKCRIVQDSHLLPGLR
jgi:hypothetical protein